MLHRRYVQIRPDGTVGRQRLSAKPPAKGLGWVEVRDGEDIDEIRGKRRLNDEWVDRIELEYVSSRRSMEIGSGDRAVFSLRSVTGAVALDGPADVLCRINRDRVRVVIGESLTFQPTQSTPEQWDIEVIDPRYFVRRVAGRPPTTINIVTRLPELPPGADKSDVRRRWLEQRDRKRDSPAPKQRA